MVKRGGLLTEEFLVRLPRDVEIVLNGHGPGSAHKLLVNTPVAAEIILAIAESETFGARGKEKHAFKTLAIAIAGRYSGH